MPYFAATALKSFAPFGCDRLPATGAPTSAMNASKIPPGELIIRVQTHKIHHTIAAMRETAAR
jgi:hypothetical protein